MRALAARPVRSTAEKGVGDLGDGPRARLEVDALPWGQARGPGGRAKRQVAPYPPDPAGPRQAEPPRYARARLPPRPARGGHPPLGPGSRPGGHAKRQVAPYPPDPAGSGQAETPRHPRIETPGRNRKARRETFGTWGG